MKYMRIFFTLWASLLLGGCAMKDLGQTRACMVVFKTPQWRFADTGFVRKDADTVELEVFEAGQRLMRVQIGDQVCVEDTGCMSKTAFNEAYLNAAYPDDLLYHVLRGEPIHSGIDVRQTGDGYMQRFRRDAYEIDYTVTYRTIEFNDVQNGIMIKLKEIQ